MLAIDAGSFVAAHCLVAALCLGCDHIRDLDVEALAERCQCEGGVPIVVSGAGRKTEYGTKPPSAAR